MYYGVWILRCRAGRLVRPVPLAVVVDVGVADHEAADHEQAVHGRDATAGSAVVTG